MNTKIAILLLMIPMLMFSQQDSSLIKALEELKLTNSKTYQELKTEVDLIHKDYESGQISDGVKTKMIRELEKHQSKNMEYGNEIKKMTNENEQIIAPMSEVISVLKNVDAFVKVVKKDVGLIQETRNINKKGIFELKKTFNTGSYTIERSQLDFTRKIYTSFCEKVINFASKNKNIPQIAEIDVNGYSDAQAIQLGSILEKELNSLVVEKVNTSKALNKILSEQRAKSIAVCLEVLFNELKSDELKNNLQIVLNYHGFGEELPTGSDSSKVDDESRRIVELKWIVLPEKFLK
jgi:hypothetical protein